MWLDWGLPPSAQCLGHEHTHRVMWDSLLDSHGRAAPTLTDWVISSWEADGWCLFGLTAVNVRVHTHTRLKHTQPGGWLALSHSPQCWFWSPFRAFLFSVFRFLLLGVKILGANWDFLHAHYKPASHFELQSSVTIQVKNTQYKFGGGKKDLCNSHLLHSRSVKMPQRWTAQSSEHSCCPKTTSCSRNLEKM